MGFALPGAVAAAMIYPDKHILSICGDAGFLMNVQEMETAKRYNCNMTVMVWEDHMYGLIAWKQTNQFGRHTDLSFDNPDWMQLASAFRWHGHQVTRADDLQGTITKALNEAGIILVGGDFCPHICPCLCLETEVPVAITVCSHALVQHP